MSLAPVHTPIQVHAFRTLFCRLPSISTIQTNTLAYSYSHAVTRTVTHKLYAHTHAQQQDWTFPSTSRLRIAGDYALDMFITYFDSIPTTTTAFDRFGNTQVHTLDIRHSQSFRSPYSLLNCHTSVLILFPTQYDSITSKSPEFRPLEAYARLA